MGLFGLGLVAALGIFGCGGGSNPVSVAVTATANTVDATDSVTLSASVTNDVNSAGVTWAVSGGGALSNTTTTSATYTAPGASSSPLTVTVTATSVADATKSSSATLTVPAAPKVTTGALAAGTVGTAYSATLAGSGGIAPYAWSLTSGTLPAGITMNAAGVISGTPTVAAVGTTSLTFKLTDSGTATALTATQTLGLTINAAPAIVFTGVMPATGIYNASYTGSAAAGGGGGTLTYTLNSGSLPTGLGLNAGTGAVTGTTTAVGAFNFSIKAADAFGDSATSSYTITVNPATPVLAFTAIPSHTYGDAPFTVSATSASGGAVTYSVTSGPATIAGNTVTLTGVGTVVLGASQVATTNYTAATATISFTVNPETPTLTFASIPTHTFGDSPFTVSATSASSGAVTYSVTSGPATIAANTVTLTGAGTVVLGASQAASGNYGTATASISFAVNPEAPTLAFAAIPTHIYGDAPFTVSATSASSGAVTYSVTSGPATIAGNTVTLTGVGTVVLGASQAATANFTSATATTSFTINQGTPTLTFAAIPTHTYGDAPFTVSASSASNGAVTYSVTSGPATIAGNSVTITGVGTVALGASQVATADYTAATASTSFTVNAEAPTLTFAAIPTHTYGDAPFTVSATSASSGAVTYSVTSGPASIVGNTVTITGVGTVGLGASQAATADYTAATASISFTVNPETPTLTFAAIPTHTFGDSPFTVSATSASSGAVTYSVTSGPATIAGNSVTLTGPGTVVLGASQAATADYTTATASTSFTVNPAVSITTPTTLPPGTINLAYSQTLAATGGTGTGYAWTITSGASQLALLNLTLSGGGLLSGTPTSTGSATFTANVTDSQSHSASATFTVTVYAALTVTTASLPGGDVGSTYSQTLSAAGGTGLNYTWSASSSNLATFGLTLLPTGIVSGAPTQTGTASFTAKVTDSGNNTATAPLTITVNSALVLPAANPVTLPTTGTTGVNYSGSINASGGSGTYSWSFTTLPSDGLSASPSGNSLAVSGKPTNPATVTFSVTLTDTATGASVTQSGYTITVSNPVPVSLPTPNPVTLPSATVNQAYVGSINASGGVSPYTWSVNGTSIPNNGSAVAISDGITVSNNGSNILTVGGTPTATGPVTLTNVQVTDLLSSTASNTYTIQVNTAGNTVSGRISLNNYCGSTPTLPTFKVSINTTPVQTVNTDSNGNYSFTGVPNGTYTVTPSIVGPSSAFYPATASVTATNTNPVAYFQVSLGYTVSGTATYGGTATGQTYITLNNTSCGGSGSPGTSISEATLTGGGQFTIRGVSPGTYTLSAWMDTLGDGQQNSSDPSYTSSGTGTISTANITGAPVTLTDPNPLNAPGSNPNINVVSPTDLGVVISFGPVTTTANGSIEAATSYIVEWSTTTSFSSTASYTFKANGAGGANVWILNNGTSGMTGSFTDGTVYYFRARAQNAAGHPSGYSYWGTSTTPTPVTIGAGTTGNQVQGTVTIPSGITPTGPLYVGFYSQTTGIFGARIASPVVGANNYTVFVPSGTGYFNFAILDQNNNGLVDVGDVTNVNQSNGSSKSVNISGPLTGQNLTLPSANSAATVQTQYQSSSSPSGSSTNYQLNFNVRPGIKLPVSVTLMSGPNVINPVDMSQCSNCGNTQYGYSVTIDSNTPNVGDAYTFLVTYSDLSTDTQTLTATVTGWNGGSSVVGAANLPSNLLPSVSGTTQPNFSWTDPASDSSDTFSFYLNDNNGNTIWQIPGENSSSNGFSNSITSLTWDVDPTGGGNTTSVTSLTHLTQYNWDIQAQDSNGNTAQTQVYFIP